MTLLTLRWPPTVAASSDAVGCERIPDELIDELLAGARTEEEIVGPGGVLAQLTKRLVERAMEVELTDHLGYERTGAAGRCGEHAERVDAEDAVASTGRWGSRRPVIARGASSRRSSASASGASRGSTTRSSRSIRAGSRRGISRRTSRRSTALRSAAT